MVQKIIFFHHQMIVLPIPQGNRALECMDRHDSVHIQGIGRVILKTRNVIQKVILIVIFRTYADALSPENPVQPTPVPRMGTANMTTSNATPTMQQRIKNIGVATPLNLAVSSPIRRYAKYLYCKLSFHILNK
jgi:hypothetical protein